VKGEGPLKLFLRRRLPFNVVERRSIGKANKFSSSETITTGRKGVIHCQNACRGVAKGQAVAWGVNLSLRHVGKSRNWEGALVFQTHQANLDEKPVRAEIERQI